MSEASWPCSIVAITSKYFCVEQILVVLEQPGDAVAARIGELLVGLEHEDEIAVRLVALFLVPDHVRDPGRRHVLVVAGAAAVVVAVLLDELEWIGRPVLG